MREKAEQGQGTEDSAQCHPPALLTSVRARPPGALQVAAHITHRGQVVADNSGALGVFAHLVAQALNIPRFCSLK